MPGVTVTASAPTLQGTRETVTSDNGDYILPLLPPGVYTITFQLSGFGTVSRTVTLLRRNRSRCRCRWTSRIVRNRQRRRARSDVLTGTAQVGTNFTQALMNLLPTGRDLNAGC